MLSEQERKSFRITPKDLSDPTLARLNNNLEFLGELISDLEKKHRDVKQTADSAIPWASGSPASAGKHVDRLAVHPDDAGLGFLFYETDRRSLYQVQYIFPGRLDLVFVFGCMYGPLLNLPTDLESKDTGFLYFVTDYRHLLRWTGTGWDWGPGEAGSDYIWMFANAPNPATGWQLCDGSTVARLNPDGTTTNVVLPNYVGGIFPKFGAAYDGPHVAVMPKIWGESEGRTDPNTMTTTLTCDEGGDNSGPVDHTVTDPAHYHTARNLQPDDTHPIPWAGVPGIYYRR